MFSISFAFHYRHWLKVNPYKPFSKVELGRFAIGDALDLDQRGFFVLVAEATSVTGKHTFRVQTAHGG